MSEEASSRERKRAYVAGPLFSESERWFDERISLLCEELGLETYLPHVDGGLQDAENGERIFASDLAALDAADVIVANLDGVDVDAGTAWEIGYAFAHGKAIVGVRTDRRVLEPWAAVNLMIACSTVVVHSIEALRSTIPGLLE